MMKENPNTQSFEHIIICQNELYIVSTTPDKIQDQYPHDPGGRDIINIK